MIIEPKENFKEKYPLVMAPSLADLNRGTTAKVKIMNPFDEHASIKYDAVIANAEDLDKDGVIATILDNEDEDTKHLNSCVRSHRYLVILQRCLITQQKGSRRIFEQV